MYFEKNYDVAVAGAGIAGVAAAVQAAREGKRVILIEKSILPGGLATSGLVYIYLPLCDGAGHQVSFGITEELLRASIQYGPGSIDSKWKENRSSQGGPRFSTFFSPAAYILALDEFLLKNKVDVWYDTLVCDTVANKGKLTGIFVENESGRGLIHAKCFVDSTGSALLARRAGIPCNDAVNFLSVWDVEYDKRVTDNSDLGTPLQVRMLGIPWDESKAPEGTLFRGIDGESVTRFVLKSRELLRKHYTDAYSDTVTRENCYSVKVPAMPQFRKIYGIDAEFVLHDDQNQTRFEDSIGLVPDWRKPGPVWEIPYRTLYPKKRLGGYLAAGRCIGSNGDAWEVTRVIPPAGLTGQVAGLAASMSIDAGVEPYELDVKSLQARLRACGFPLHLPEAGLMYK